MPFVYIEKVDLRSLSSAHGKWGQKRKCCIYNFGLYIYIYIYDIGILAILNILILLLLFILYININVAMIKKKYQK